MRKKFMKKKIDSNCPVGITLRILYGNPKAHKTTLRYFDLFYLQ